MHGLIIKDFYLQQMNVYFILIPHYEVLVLILLIIQQFHKLNNVHRYLNMDYVASCVCM